MRQFPPRTARATGGLHNQTAHLLPGLPVRLCMPTTTMHFCTSFSLFLFSFLFSSPFHCRGQNPCQRCFPHQATSVDPSTMTQESCAKGCHDQNYDWAAVENGNECFCSNNPIDNNACPESDGMCDDNICPGDPNGVEVSFVFLLLVRWFI